VEEFDGASIHEEVELEAKPEENVRSVLIGRNARDRQGAPKRMASNSLASIFDPRRKEA